MRTMHTIGHSTRSFEELLELLQLNRVERLADVRRHPGSRRYPQFSSETLKETLEAAGIRYIHMPELGGRRNPRPDSLNGGWRVDAFRGYADYMATDEFAEGIERLLSDPASTVVMCAEAVPWRCHRNLISDDLVRRGVEVLHIISAKPPSAHVMNPMARIVGDHLEYPGEQSGLFAK